jgi:hypothetical protein
MQELAYLSIVGKLRNRMTKESVFDSHRDRRFFCLPKHPN